MSVEPISIGDSWYRIPRINHYGNTTANKVNSDRKHLQSRYYRRNIEEIKSSNCRKWSKGVSCLCGEPVTINNPLVTMVNQLHGGDMNALLSDIIFSFSQLQQLLIH